MKWSIKTRSHPGALGRLTTVEMSYVPHKGDFIEIFGPDSRRCRTLHNTTIFKIVAVLHRCGHDEVVEITVDPVEEK